MLGVVGKAANKPKISGAYEECQLSVGLPFVLSCFPLFFLATKDASIKYRTQTQNTSRAQNQN